MTKDEQKIYKTGALFGLSGLIAGTVFFFLAWMLLSQLL